MRKNKGFTLIELMVVILIVAILAAVLAPMMTGRIRDAKWTEGKAAAGTIATAIRAFVAEHEGLLVAGGANLTDGVSSAAEFEMLGMTAADLNGKYFDATMYSVSSVSYDATTGDMTYRITIDPPDTLLPGTWTLNGGGDWSYTAP